MNNLEDIQKSYTIDMGRLNAAKKDAYLKSPCGDLNECLMINSDLDREMNRLAALKLKYNLKDFLEPEDMYMLDPTDKTGTSNQVKYSPDMFNINLGVPSCNTAGCNTIDDSLYRINPNVPNNFLPKDEIYTLSPGGNSLTTKWELEEKQKFKIYPHMYSDTVNLINRQKEEDSTEGGISYGGVDYPIPMRFQLRYLQQPGHKGISHNIDYDVHTKTKDKNLPEYHDKIMSRELNLRRPDAIQHNRQRGINDTDFVTNTLGDTYDKLAKGELRLRDALRKQAREVNREYGNYPTEQEAASAYHAYEERLQNEREDKQARDIMTQPLYWYQYKDYPRSITTSSNVSSPFQASSVKRQMFPTSAAQTSGFFELGPPLPPPNPELLSAVPSEMLVNQTKLATITDASVFEVPKPENRDKFLLRTDLDNSLNPYDISDTQLNNLLKSNGSTGGVDQPLIEGFDQIPSNYKFPDKESQCGDEPKTVNLIDLWLAKELALQRILFQMTHLRRLEPLLRRKQVQSKEVSHTININKTTMHLEKTANLLNQLDLMNSLLTEERGRVIELLRNEYIARGMNGHTIEQKMAETQKKIKMILEKRASGSTNNRRDFSVGGDNYIKPIPADKGVFYTQTNFQGPSIELSFGMYDFPDVGGIGNNKLASFKIPENTTLNLYEYPKKRGVKVVYNGPARVALLPARWANRISGIEFISAPPPYDAKVYSGPEYQGNVASLKPGFYDYPNFGGTLPNLGSFTIPKELILTLYSRPNKGGQKVTYIGPFEMSKLDSGWNNNVKSLEIQMKTISPQ